MSQDAPVTEEEYLEARVKFFHGFTRFALFNVIIIVALVALLGIFLG